MVQQNPWNRNVDSARYSTTPTTPTTGLMNCERIMRRYRDQRNLVPCSSLGVHPANRRGVHPNKVSEGEQVRNGGGDLSNQDGKRESPGEMRFEGPTSLRLTRETSSDYLGNGKLETEIADRPKAKNSEAIDVDNRSSKTMKYDPSGLRPARGGSNLREREQGREEQKQNRPHSRSRSILLTIYVSR